MKQKAPAGIRYVIMLLPVIAIAGLVAAKRHETKHAAEYVKKNSNTEIIWHCRVISRPHFKIFDSARMAMSLPSSKDSVTSEITTPMTITVSTPKRIQYHTVTAYGTDVQYRRRVCKFVIGDRGFNVINGEILNVDRTAILLGSGKKYVTLTENGPAKISTIQPAWYAALGPRYMQQDMASIYVEERPVSNLRDIPSPSGDKILPAHVLNTPTFAGLDCSKFAIGVQFPTPQPSAKGLMTEVRPMDLVMATRDTAAINVNGVREEFRYGRGALKVGSANFTILNEGNYLQTPAGPLILSGAKQYITISAANKASITTARPAWFEAFAKTPPVMQTSRTTVGPE